MSVKMHKIKGPNLTLDEKIINCAIDTMRTVKEAGTDSEVIIFDLIRLHIDGIVRSTRCQMIIEDLARLDRMLKEIRN